MGRKNDYLEHLAEVPLFRACSRKDLQTLAKHAEDMNVRSGQTLIKEGAVGAQEFFVIVNGKANVTRNGKKVASLGPGDYFGELALLDRAPRNATVTAASDMEVVVLAQRDFATVLNDVPGISHKILAGMARRLRENDSKRVQ
ncbi:MAG: cyclic nucleotide-binding domain-containing protein [Actinomycetota bacterium]|nr:cyclic nucleotide-binding domain-containing protein [Actinomycetota bacterium]